MNKLFCLLLVLFTFNTVHGQSPVTTFPFTEGFENQDFKSSWNIYERGAEGPGWTVRGYLVHSGDSSIVHADGGPIQDGWLVTPPIVLPAGNVYTLSSWSAIRYPMDYDAKHNAKISTLVSTGSGDPADGEFVEIWTPASVPQDWEYYETALDLTAYAGKKIYIAFRYQGDGYGWCLDDVSLTKIADNDVGITAITSPISGKNLTNKETVTVTVNNFSVSTQNQIPIHLEIDGKLIANETIVKIDGQGQVNYTFTTKVDLSAVKKYTVNVYTTLNDDPNPDNDAMTVDVRNYGTGVISSFPYSESFENDDDLFLWTQEQDAVNLSWKFQKGDGSGVITPHSEQRNAFFYSLYTRGSVKLVTPPLNLTALKSPVVKFWYFQEDYYGMLDTLTVYVKNSPTANWTQLFKGTKATTEWTEQTLQLPDPSTEYYIAFEGTAGIGDGILLDDVTVSNPVDKDIELRSIEGPVNGPNMSLEPVVIRVKNMGLETLSQIPISYNIDGKVVHETIAGPLNTFEEYTYTFTTKADLSVAKTYNIEVYTSLSGDQVSQNNMLSTQVTNYGNKAIMGAEPSFTTCDVTFVDDGVDEPYIQSAANQIQTVTFYPAEEGKRVQATFTMFSTSPYEILSGIEFPGDTLIVYDGNKVVEDNRLAAFVGDLTGNLPDPVVSHAADGSLTFVFKKFNGLVEDGWEATIACVDPLLRDAGVLRILSPLKGGNSAAEVKVLVKNFGANPITSMDINYYNAAKDKGITERFTGNLLPGEIIEYTFKQTADVSEFRENHEITSATFLEGDENPDNNKAAIYFPYRPNITLYGYRLYDKNAGYGAVSFGSNDPETVNTINTYTDQGNPVSAGEQVGEYLYVYSTNNTTRKPSNFIKLTKDWQVVSSQSVAQIIDTAPLDMAYDYSTNTMFAITFNQDVSDYQRFNEVNMTTGAITQIGIFPSHYFNAIACDKDGQVYGMSKYGAFCSINKMTGEVIEISHTGIFSDYLQSMTFDHATGRLFWAMTSAKEGKLYEINPATGAITDYGTIGGNAEIVALYTPYNGTKIATPVSDPSFTVYPNPSDGFITISAIPENSSIRIVDLSGRTLQTYSGLSGQVELNLNLKSGIYFIQMDNNDEKISRKLIIK